MTCQLYSTAKSSSLVLLLIYEIMNLNLLCDLTTGEGPRAEVDCKIQTGYMKIRHEVLYSLSYIHYIHEQNTHMWQN